MSYSNVMRPPQSTQNSRIHVDFFSNSRIHVAKNRFSRSRNVTVHLRLHLHTSILQTYAHVQMPLNKHPILNAPSQVKTFFAKCSINPSFYKTPFSYQRLSPEQAYWGLR